MAFLWKSPKTGLPAWFFFVALSAFAQNTTADQIVLPADKTDTHLTLALPEAPAKGASVALQPITDSNGKRLAPQPSIDNLEVSGDSAQFDISNVYFWGGARLGVEVSGVAAPYVYTLQRGPIPASNQIAVERGKPAVIWLYNSGTMPYTATWRIVSGAESVCGRDVNGKTRAGCGSPANQPGITIAPASTGRLEFEAPDKWFGARDSVRSAILELRFGPIDSSQMEPIPLQLEIHGAGFSILGLWFPLAASGVKMLWVTFGITLGAILLMLAQVMIPNFRKCLGMQNHVDRLEERMRGISAVVGNRLSMRCHQEIESVRHGLGMARSTSKLSFTLDGFILSGNSEEVTRIAGVIPKVESRVRLTESLDERQTAEAGDGQKVMPPSLCWSREQQLRNVESILAGHFVTDVDEKNAQAMLDLLADEDAQLKQFTADLDSRVASVRWLFETDPWKSKGATIITALGLDECTDLLSRTTDTIPTAGWTMEELIRRDLAAVKLSIVNQMIEIEALLAAAPDVLAGVQRKIRSNEPDVLADARNDLVKLSQGVSTQDVMTALKDGMWDALLEPGEAAITDQSMVRVTLVFRDKRLDRSAARNSFQCSWHIEPEDYFEDGWEFQFLPKQGKLVIEPHVYESGGKEVEIRSTASPDKGVFNLTVERSPYNALHARLLRGLLDSVITAVIPILTVALTQVQDVSLEKLVLLGFSSQAIRAAVVPDPVGAAAVPVAAPAAAPVAAKAGGK